MRASTAIYASIIKPAVVGGIFWAAVWVLNRLFGLAWNPEWGFLAGAGLMLVFGRASDGKSPDEAGKAMSTPVASPSPANPAGPSPGPGTPAQSPGQRLYRQREMERAIPLLVQEAQAGDVKSQFMLGEAVYNGLGTQQDHQAGAGWLMKAAIAGDPDAQNTVGAMFSQDSPGFGRNPEKSLGFLEAAAMQGHPDANANLAMTYLHGTGVPKDEKRASEYLERAIALGSPLANTMKMAYPQLISPARTGRT